MYSILGKKDKITLFTYGTLLFVTIIGNQICKLNFHLKRLLDDNYSVDFKRSCLFNPDKTNDLVEIKRRKEIA
ncbi:hypothetical protein BpHYR1_020669 [Brachionus plicatilis]|uniref:Uncharacterized protein n=1 Tax=Brachionus plicatilis TaxID=10195 RepID=A0A3M7T7B4_BRAPC|nr:hypothetical protein BpHYR1_020669 [Brachionus plicatilis]